MRAAKNASTLYLPDSGQDSMPLTTEGHNPGRGRGAPADNDLGRMGLVGSSMCALGQVPGARADEIDWDHWGVRWRRYREPQAPQPGLLRAAPAGRRPRRAQAPEEADRAGAGTPGSPRPQRRRPAQGPGV